MEHSVAVIIPIYNAEKTLSLCLDSVLQQKCPNLRVYAINNDSTDASSDILSKYASKDNRIHVGYVGKAGVSRARNAALAMADSKYVCFVDSDDCLPEGSIQSRVEALERSSADLLVAPYLNIINSTSIKCDLIHDDDVISSADYLTNLSVYPNHFYYSALWNKLYRMDILRSHHIRFDESLKWGEDSMFNLVYAAYINQVYVMHTPVYNYNRSLNGLSGQSGLQVLLHPVKTCKARVRLFKALKKLYGTEESKKLLAAFLKPTF